MHGCGVLGHPVFVEPAGGGPQNLDGLQRGVHGELLEQVVVRAHVGVGGPGASREPFLDLAGHIGAGFFPGASADLLAGRGQGLGTEFSHGILMVEPA